MRDHNEIDDMEPLLELHEHCHSHSHPEVEHKCANACLDGIRTILDYGFEHEGLNYCFGGYGPPTLAEVVRGLEKPGGKGMQMLVDMLVHNDTWESDHPGVADLIKDTESTTAMAPFFRELSYALAVKAHNVLHEGDPDNVVSTPDPMSLHAYHSYPASETACCGQLLHAPVVYGDYISGSDGESARGTQKRARIESSRPSLWSGDENISLPLSIA